MITYLQQMIQVQRMASWGNPTPKSMTISVDENGNITGLPALASGNLTIVRTP